MLGFVNPRRLLAALVVCCLAPSLATLEGQGSQAAAPPFPSPETLRYTIEWRLFTAGTATVQLQRSGAGWHSRLKLESAGFVSKLYTVNDIYDGQYAAGMCAESVHLVSIEGRRRRDTTVTYDRARNKAVYLEKDLVKNNIAGQHEIDVPHCVHDVLGALVQLRTLRIDLGKSVDLPVSDGKKSAMVRIEAKEREDVKINGQVRKTIRYEAFLFNNVIYSRKASLYIWLTDDARRTPVQLSLRMGFPIGTVTLTLDKEERQ